MKKLTLIRHAKAGWHNGFAADLDRPLDDQGWKEAPMMGKRLAARRCTPDLVVCSPATRALTTAEVIAQELEYPFDEIRVDRRVYGSDAIQLLDLIQTLDGTNDHVMCVGHNPTMTDLVNYLLPDRYVRSLPTCGVVEITYDTETWMLVGHLEPVEIHYDYPTLARESMGEEQPRPLRD